MKTRAKELADWIATGAPLDVQAYKDVHAALTELVRIESAAPDLADIGTMVAFWNKEAASDAPAQPPEQAFWSLLEHCEILLALAKRQAGDNAALHAGPWMVVRAREQFPIEAWDFRDDETQARSFYDEVSANWSDTYLCRVVAGLGKPQQSIPLHPLIAKARAATEECDAARSDLADQKQLTDAAERDRAVFKAELESARQRIDALEESLRHNQTEQQFYRDACTFQQERDRALAEVQRLTGELEATVKLAREQMRQRDEMKAELAAARTVAAISAGEPLDEWIKSLLADKAAYRDQRDTVRALHSAWHPIPTESERKAHPGLWLAKLRNGTPCIGAFKHDIVGMLFALTAGGAIYPNDIASVVGWWPCDNDGNRVAWPVPK